MSALFRFFSDAPLLRKICISGPGQIIQDISLDQVISLESLEEFECAYSSGNRILPYLKLPSLKQLRMSSSLGLGEVQKLVDVLPCDGHALLARTTEMSYCFDGRSLRVDLSGNGVDVSLSVIGNRPSVDWFSDQTFIPFGRIEVLRIHDYSNDADFPVNVVAFENLGVLRTYS